MAYGLLETVQAFFKIFSSGDIDARRVLRAGCRAGSATQSARKRPISHPRDAAGISCAEPTLTAEKTEIVVAGETALSIVKWTLRGTAPGGEAISMEGTTSDRVAQTA